LPLNISVRSSSENVKKLASLEQKYSILKKQNEILIKQLISSEKALENLKSSKSSSHEKIRDNEDDLLYSDNQENHNYNKKYRNS
jgi:hypothetical protein